MSLRTPDVVGFGVSHLTWRRLQPAGSALLPRRADKSVGAADTECLRHVIAVQRLGSFSAAARNYGDDFRRSESRRGRGRPLGQRLRHVQMAHLFADGT
jgi:hypothetical protein